MQTIRIKDLLIPKHQKVLEAALDHDYTHYMLKGGRGGVKSTAIGVTIPLLMVQEYNKEVHAVVFRKVANTLRDSVFAQISAGISMLGIDEYFKRTTSPMEITYKPTGQKILFRGLDEPEKIKSIKAPFGYFGITWFEELDQYHGREELRSVLQSTMRGAGGRFWNFESFNPPISSANWANKDSRKERDDRLVVESSYLDVPVEWLSESFVEQADYLRVTDNRAYRHEYLGEAVGTGGSVFDRIIARRIDDAELARFDRIYQGLDWGWFPDQLAFIRLHYDHARQIVYLLDEYYVNKTPNDQVAKWIKDNGYADTRTTCDSAEPKSVFDVRRLGINAGGAVKGPDSVDYGMKWLQGKRIVIDERRTPNAYREFIEYEYERDKNGDVVTGYPDLNNHLIDATRYALEGLMRSGKTAA